MTLAGSGVEALEAPPRGRVAPFGVRWTYKAVTKSPRRTLGDDVDERAAPQKVDRVSITHVTVVGV